ncbi:hypothetical protein VNO77_46902 [Canavalia gladiata]|uniref:Uncharacterized protein n=1 Tax=Canavalia gladiata TaxID=3824 RepID=A0AAN9PIK4_CANGL
MVYPADGLSSVSDVLVFVGECLSGVQVSGPCPSISGVKARILLLGEGRTFSKSSFSLLSQALKPLLDCWDIRRSAGLERNPIQGAFPQPIYTRCWSRSRLAVPLSMIVDSTLISCLSWRALPPSIESSNSLSEILPPRISCFLFLRIGS